MDKIAFSYSFLSAALEGDFAYLTFKIAKVVNKKRIN